MPMRPKPQYASAQAAVEVQLPRIMLEDSGINAVVYSTSADV